MQYSENTVKYRFCDTDETGWDEYDIEGENYHILIDVCSRYCTSVSFDIYPQYENAEYLLQIQKYLIKRDNTYRKVTSKIGSCVTGSDKRYYTVCTEMCDLLKKEKSIFSWFWEEEKQLFHFENLTFYRDDGTVFFESITHEGECYLYAKETEDISQIVSNKLWEKNPKPIIFDLSPKTEEEIAKIHKELQRIKNEKYIQDLKLVKEIIDIIDCRNKLSLQSHSDIIKIADKFGFSVDKVIDDLLALY